MTDQTTPEAAPLDPVAKFTFPNLDGEQSFDVRGIPDATRLDFLKGAVRAYIANRLNGIHTRHQKDDKVAAWNAYDEAQKADAFQTTVAQPTFERPAEPDYAAGYTAAIEALTTGNIRKVGEGTPKARVTADPLVKVVTGVVVDAVYKSGKANDPKYSYIDARKAVGGDGIKYLNTAIDAKVEAGADRAQLEKMRDEMYINPAKAMLGLSVSKKVGELPSIL